MPLVHVWPDAAEIGRVWQPTVGVAADPEHFLKAIICRNELSLG